MEINFWAWSASSDGQIFEDKEESAFTVDPVSASLLCSKRYFKEQMHKEYAQVWKQK